ncbi:hypothetical protein [Aliikangiella coralliicola]|uniref:Uncharacterized protein n=1 Tax=Aliikangiella coralliicola TaxID=2592383 RepID=A0A545U082_9GAMM|nr:hypothetical protein [Aliikangiella coralliicola]TQV82874.1 hypothetical protein FLL46_24195 [Aliikangiella coralliicola]
MSKKPEYKTFLGAVTNIRNSRNSIDNLLENSTMGNERNKSSRLFVGFFGHAENNNQQMSNELYQLMSSVDNYLEITERYFENELEQQKIEFQKKRAATIKEAIYAWIPWFSKIVRWSLGVVATVLLYSYLIYWSAKSQAPNCDPVIEKTCKVVEWKFVIPVKDSINQIVNRK